SHNIKKETAGRTREVLTAKAVGFYSGVPLWATSWPGNVGTCTWSEFYLQAHRELQIWHGTNRKHVSAFTRRNDLRRNQPKHDSLFKVQHVALIIVPLFEEGKGCLTLA
ncbi:MAG TPA: hypothetical protein VFU32_08385, partial [Ktedonobacterales bacterium]|nr:hypothetical protein [Ktedonobacterales bacterium]